MRNRKTRNFHHYKKWERRKTTKTWKTNKDKVIKTGKIVCPGLPHYEPNPTMEKLFKSHFQLTGEPTIEETKIFNLINSPSESFKLNQENYYDVFSTAVQLEDLHQQSEETFTNCRIVHLTFLSTENKHLYRFWLRKGDRIPLDTNPEYLQLYTEANPWSIHEVIFQFSTSKYMHFLSYNALDLTQNYTIKFESSSRLTLRLEYWALEQVKKYQLAKILLNPPQTANENDDYNQHDFKFIERKISQNPEQETAVKSIVLSSRPPSVPYLLIGYPGTGKTQTIVECIHQLLMRNPKNRILVCAGINSILDEITVRIQKSLNSTPNQVKPYKILRYYSMSNLNLIPKSLLPISNFAKIYKGPTDETGIVLCTFVMAGQLAFENSTINFTHLFIDEAQSATETQTLIPIVAFWCSRSNIKAQIILAGDTKQLGPVIKTKEANKLGYGCSMMERLMNCDIYQPYADTKLFNHSVTCKLVRNYRSHPDILKIPNELFYNNEMISCAKIRPDRMVVNSLRSVGIIRNEFSNVFHCVYGFMQTCSSSLYNEDEISYLINLLKRLTRTRNYDESEIGIITPYKQQALKIKEMLKKYNKNKVKVGTVKQFIGQEKSVIIVSTVRSGTKELGFIDDEKRINVLLTRAISLMIFIGNIKTLSQNPLWERIIQNCTENHSIIQQLENE